ncbi:SSU ribosomal protein S2p (SAe) [hydrothermal vent metagenome]|uniref:SSU ribosomal protein S2p (SAe) n=1 Tax=hydrothermal vent metagenome TaxID=652676 RepID=A0A3B1C702_9ZZZZ
MSDVTIKRMMETGLHFGHQTKRWNPKMRKYIFGSRNGIYIIDLQQTLEKFKKAIAFTRELAARRGKVLFIGTKSQAKDIIFEQATRCGMPYVRERWLGGMLTNYETIKMSIGRLNQLDGMEEDGSFKVLAKKEVIKLQKEKLKLERYLGGIRDMGGLPDAVFIVDTKKEKIALSEAVKLKVPVIAIVDTNCDPDGIDYIIPGNDDANRAIELISSAIADAILEGANEYDMKEKAVAQEREQAATERKKLEDKEMALKKEGSGAAKDKAGDNTGAEAEKAAG